VLWQIAVRLPPESAHIQAGNPKVQIANDCVVSIHFELTNDRGELLDRSRDGEPLVYLHGVSGILPALEEGLGGKSAGDSFEVHIAPEEGFGTPQQELISRVPRSAFPDNIELTVGMQVQGRSDTDERQFTIIAMDAESITVDGNHPLAGMQLCFRGNVVDVRQATADELENWSDGMEAQ
jgi:FKBP-type peptidyl-prolyl cis-trans isomerase SlyD